MPRKYVVLASIVLLIVFSLIIGAFLTQGRPLGSYLIVNYESEEEKHNEEAIFIIDRSIFRLLEYVHNCKRFPANFKDAHRSIENAPFMCKPFDFGFTSSIEKGERYMTPWIDPWGRPYQIRYHKERRKLQMRSKGENPDDLSDDIVRETTLGNAGAVFNKEIKKCNELSESDMGCVFNRGWH